ncbi:hypothetical protein G4D82_01150 [Flavobacterium sp. CYK-4]|uniref:hypothetical protein n=1 Tax=Flavobacterium lotistagni TaxID=2709660 RepID=UPI001407CF5E|nr:hypothetical protein [Flavobacterium lotistagni]NHM05815.1 hypothetical protein [Flavobacterium lotistagni]
MKTRFSLLLLLLTSWAKAQTIHNNVAVQDGYWNDCATWNFPNTIYNSAHEDDYYKTIRADKVVTQNLPEVYVKKINLSQGSKIILQSNNKIKLQGYNTTPVTSTPACPTTPYLDNVFIDFNETVAAKSLSGLLHGLSNWEEAKETNPNLYNTYPIEDVENKIIPLKPKLFRQGRPQKYQLAYDLTRTMNGSVESVSGRVHMVLSDSWATRCWNSTADSGGFRYENEFPNWPVGGNPQPDALEQDCKHCYVLNTVIENGVPVTYDCGDYSPYKEVPTTIIPGQDNYSQTMYNNLLNKWFAWGNEPDAHGHSYKPGIIWECWNEPDYYEFWESKDTTTDTNLAVEPDKWHIIGGENLKYWPEQKKQNFFKTYAMFYNKFKDFKNTHPDAECAGPSFAIFNETHFREFFDYCLNHKDQNGNPEPLEVNVVTWHELDYILDSNAITHLREHVSFIRDNFMNNPKYKKLNIKSIDINEIVGESYRHNPAIQAYYLGGLEQAGVDHASKSSWQVDPDNRASGFDNRLTNLFNREGQKRPNWWVYKLYSDGVEKRVKSYNEEIRSIVIANNTNVNPPTETHYAQVLFGYTDPEGTRPYGAYKINLNNLTAIMPGANQGTHFKIRIKKLKNPDDETESAANEYENIPEIDYQDVYRYPNTYTPTGTGPYTMDSDGSITLIVKNIERENLYQMAIFKEP